MRRPTTVPHVSALNLHPAGIMKTLLQRVIAAALGIGAGPGALAAQEPASDKLRVFIDCNFCDMDFLRTEINWIDHMRDRADAHVHLLVTRQQTGGGGNEHTLEFIGLRQFVGRTDTLKHVSTVDDTQDVVRHGLTRTIKVGLVPFVAQTPLGRVLEVTVPTTGGAAPPAPQRDPWNFWSFSIGVNGFTFGESLASVLNLSGNITANRTTEQWKINTRLRGSYSEDRFEYIDDDTLTETLSLRRNYETSLLVARSIGPHFSLGGRTSASTSTFGNTSLAVSFSPAIEYNFFPYAQSTRRSLIIQYTAGARYAAYRDTTIFGEMEETRPVHTLAVGYATRQPWGSISVGVNGSQYLHDRGKYSTGIGGDASLRIFRGFSFNIDGAYQRVRDQLSLAARDLTEEEILLRQRQLATDFSYVVSFGISYRFGSIFNNVVNPRMGTVAGAGFFF
jgi:hypothetical protein